jgi:hypothetical protein
MHGHEPDEKRRRAYPMKRITFWITYAQKKRKPAPWLNSHKTPVIRASMVKELNPDKRSHQDLSPSASRLTTRRCMYWAWTSSGFTPRPSRIDACRISCAWFPQVGNMTNTAMSTTSRTRCKKSPRAVNR